MKIYTYFQPIGNADAVKLVPMFREAWEAEGYEVIVLDESEAIKSPFYPALNECVSKYPTVNGVEYERQCYIRWAALANVTNNIERTCFLDFDVFPNWNWHMPETWGFSCLGGIEPCPGFLIGWKRSWEQLIGEIINWSFPCPKHNSDMTIIKGSANRLFDQHLFVWQCYLHERWENKPAIHFANDSMCKKSFRSEQIKQVMEWADAERKRGIDFGPSV